MRHVRPSRPLQALALSGLLAACGSAPPPLRTPEPTDAPIGMSAGGELPPEPTAEGAIELTLRRADGTFIDVGELRGQIVVLLVLATFDGASQMSLRPLAGLAEVSPEVQILGIAAQPSARLLVEAYQHALNPPFPITYDPQGMVAEGRSSLGPVTVPTLIVLDRRGVETGRHVGYCDGPCLAELVASAR